MAKNGGARPGAGRKPKPKPEPRPYSAEEFLRAVVEGREEPNAIRVAAARALIRFETAVKRAPVPSPRAADIARREKLDETTTAKRDWEAKRDAVLRKHGRTD